MFESEIINLIYSKMLNSFQLSFDEMKTIYEKEINKIELFAIKQDIPHEIVNLVNDKKCNFISSKWLNKFYDNGRKPTIYNKNYKYGDLTAFDGEYDIIINKYDITIFVHKYSACLKKCEFKFKFDEKNNESLNCFFKLFDSYIKEKYFRNLIYDRLNEIADNEINKIKKIHKKICHEL